MEASEERVTHVPANDGKQLWVAGELITFKVLGEETGGAYALTDSWVPPGGGPPIHVHHGEAEAFWVLEGELEIVAGGQTFTARAGSLVHLPKDVPHGYTNAGTMPARFLTLLVPAGLERFFEQVGKPGTDLAAPPPFDDEDIDRLVAIAAEYGVTVLPPNGP